MDPKAKIDQQVTGKLTAMMRHTRIAEKSDTPVWCGVFGTAIWIQNRNQVQYSYARIAKNLYTPEGSRSYKLILVGKIPAENLTRSDTFSITGLAVKLNLDSTQRVQITHNEVKIQKTLKASVRLK